MNPTRSAKRAAWACGVLGGLVAVLLFAPALWLAHGIAMATQGQVQLVNPRGTMWRGQADLLFTGGAGSRGQTALPQGIRWRIKPTWSEGQPAIWLSLTAPCCTQQPVRVTVLPQWQGAELRVASVESQWPAGLLTGLGTPWNTLRLDGQLRVLSPGMNVAWRSGRSQMDGTASVDALDVSSSLSSLRPLGSYRVELASSEEGNTATIKLSTLRGDMLLQGDGRWVGGRLRFEGDAQAAEGREAALSNLLNILGRRDGRRSLLKIG